MRIGHDALGQFDCSHSQRPNIGLVGVLAVAQNFGAHPVGRAHLRAVSGVGVHALGGYAKICQFGDSFVIEQNIGSLDIPVYLLAGVQVGQSLDDGLQYARDFVLVQLPLGDIDEIDDAARVAILQHDPQLAVLEVGPVVFDDVLVVAELQDLDFFLDCC